MVQRALSPESAARWVAGINPTMTMLGKRQYLSKESAMSDHKHGHHDHSHDTHPHQLQPPHEVFHDPKAGEVLRAWITNGGLSLAVHAMAFGKADTWGQVLAGTAAQVAGAMAEMGHGTPS